MNVLLNRHLFTQTNLDSGSLTMLGMLVHRVMEPGEYLGTVLRNNEAIADLHVTVDRESAATQVNIDLAELHELSAQRCPCEGWNRFVVAPEGYIVFHVSHGPGGYAVRLARRDAQGERLEFDSQTLRDGDVFAATVIRPGTYRVTNSATRARGQLTVSYPPRGRERLRAPDPAPVDCTSDALRPARIQVVPTQGQVYRCTVPSRILIELTKADDGPERPTAPGLARWRKPTGR